MTAVHPEYKEEVERRARIFALFGDPTRLKILQLLTGAGPSNVTLVAAEVEMSVSCASYHLNHLRDNGAVTATREGNTVIYAMADDPLIKKLQKLIL